MRPAYGELLRGGSGETQELVKAADKLAAYIKCIEELRAGNEEFRSAEAQIRGTLEASELPEIAYFMEHFLPAFGMTLDELTKD
jgi:5'-deoxynucleotidase